MSRIVVCGYMVRHPVAGNLLAYLHYVLGLARLGHEVVYLEESGWPRSCYDPFGGTHTDDPCVGLRIVRALLASHGLDARVYYVDRDTRIVRGGHRRDVESALRKADLLLNVGGVCWLPEFTLCPRLALVDLDPLFTQLGYFGAEGLDQHHVLFTYGANIGSDGCTVPTAGRDWSPTVPPVVPDIWPRAEASDGPFTTVANWRAYGGVIHRGRHYGQKDEEFLRLLNLPSRTPQRLELALSGAGAQVRQQLRAGGWSVRDAGELDGDMTAYRAYIRRSRGELSAAKHAYVVTRSGWFSDRSVCYLAAGRPVVVQDTGIDAWLPTGRGVQVFDTAEQAADCIAEVNADYTRHRRAATELTRDVFGFDVVLPRLLEAAVAEPSRTVLPLGRAR